jgi:DNA-binding transcriptional LysR family regulator
MHTDAMSIARLDLNLLLIFDAIIQEGNITRAGARLGLSQPAVSAALARLRDVIGDPLFIRTRHGVVPTERAKQIAQPLEAALNAIRELLQQQALFDPITSDRCFRILMLDVGEMNLLPRLLNHLREIGSPLSVATTQISGETHLDLLERGGADVAFGYWPHLTQARGFDRQVLFTDHFACLARAGHPHLSDPVTLDELLQAAHIVVSSREDGAWPLRDVLPPTGIRVVARIPHYLAVPLMLEQSDLVVVMPARPAAVFARDPRFHVYRLGFDLPSFEVCQYWHQRFGRDPGLQWLTRTMQKLLIEEPMKDTY